MALPPPQRVKMGAFYRVLRRMELAAEFGYTTVNAVNSHSESWTGIGVVASVSLQALVPWRSSCNGLVGRIGVCTGKANYFRDYKRLGVIAKLATSYKRGKRRHHCGRTVLFTRRVIPRQARATPPSGPPEQNLRQSCSEGHLQLCRLAAHPRHASWVTGAMRHHAPGHGLQLVLHRSASEDTGVRTALARGGPPERQNLRRRGATHGGGAASLWPDDGQCQTVPPLTLIIAGHKMHQNQRLENVPGSVLVVLQTGRF